MSLKRYAAKRDDNEPTIIQALRAAGATVAPLSGDNVPDLLVGYRGHTILMEVKSEKGRLQKGQREFIENWDGGTIAVVRNVEDAIEILNIHSEYKYTIKKGLT